MTKSDHRSLRQLTGRAKSQYLRALGDRLGATPERMKDLEREIVGVTVRGHAARLTPSRVSASGALPDARLLEDATSVSSPADETGPAAVAAEPAPPASATGKRKRGKEKAEPAPSQAAGTFNAATNDAPFNPYGFSAMAVLLNEGRSALEAKLARATTPEQIAQLAEAQSVRIAPEVLSAKPVDLAKLRAAFIDAVQQRIAHRRAVSSA